MTIQILHYEFLGPVKLFEWGPPMEQVVYIILSRDNDKFNIIFADQCEKASKTDFFTNNGKFRCWISNAGSKENTYLAIYPMWKSAKLERKVIVEKIISQFHPICNVENQTDSSDTS